MPLKSLSEKPVVLITGGGSGIGAAVARRLSSSHKVVVCGRRREPLEIIANETNGLAIVTDLADPEMAQNVIKRVDAEFGRLDGLVLNAGTVVAAPVADMTLNDWQLQIDVNLTAPFVIAKSAIPLLLKQKGAIVTISSVAGTTVGSGLCAYSASKAGVSLLTQTIAFEYARLGLRANVVAPGWVRTEMADMEMSALMNGGDINIGYERVNRHVPQRRAALPSEVANVVAFLISDEASYVNGATINVDGGGSVVNTGLIEFDS